MSHPAVPRREASARETGGGPARAGVRRGMSTALRAALFTGFALLWLSGACWLVLHLAFQQSSSFGPLPNPWEPVVLKSHGVLAVVGVFLLGWVTAVHLAERRNAGWNYRTGLVLAGTAALLVLSGYALYYTTGSLNEVAARTHECVGVASLLAALAHWWRARPAR